MEHGRPLTECEMTTIVLTPDPPLAQYRQVDPDRLGVGVTVFYYCKDARDEARTACEPEDLKTAWGCRRVARRLTLHQRITSSGATEIVALFVPDSTSALYNILLRVSSHVWAG